MEMPLVSVVIASKNAARYIRETIESVLRQDYTPREIIVVDGVSTDDTERIVRSFSGVRFIAQAGTGIADAWNTGIRESRGELIAFIDSDDVWVPHKLRVQVEYLRVHPEIQYVVSRFKYFLQSGCAIPSNFKRNLLHGDHVALIPPALLVRKKLFEEIGGFDTNIQFANDCDWFIRAKDRNVPMAIIPEVLLHKRVHSANISNLRAETSLSEMLKVLKKSIDFNKNKKIGIS